MPENPPTAPQVVVLGDINLDILMRVPVFPQPGGDGLAEQVDVSLGGSATNTAVALARLGVDTRLIGQVGLDAWGEQALAALRAEHLRLDAVGRAAGTTGLTFLVVTPDGERTMFTCGGANRSLPAAAAAPGNLAGARMLHLSGYAFLTAPQSAAAWRALELARSLGLETALDMGVEPASALGSQLPDLLRQIDMLVLGPKEALAASGRTELDAALAWLLDLGIDWIGLKLGPSGCRLISPRGEAKAPGFNVPVVDTTGAGDAFSAGLLLARLLGLSLPAAGILANALGALAVTRSGAVAALPSAAGLAEFLRQQGIVDVAVSETLEKLSAVSSQQKKEPQMNTNEHE